MVGNMVKKNDDPIFSSGDLTINWWYYDNGVLIALTGGHLFPADVNDENTHGLGCNFHINGKTGASISLAWKHEISNIQNCPIPSYPKSNVKIQETDHGSGLASGPVYGNYAIYISNRKLLMLEME